MEGKMMVLYISACLIFLNSAVCQSGSCPVSDSSLGCATYRILSVPTATGNFLKVNPDGTYSGFVWDLVNALKETAGLQFTLSLETSGEHGRQDAYGNWIGMIGQLIANTTDIIISDMTITAARLVAMDFSVPFMPDRVVIVSQANASLTGIKYASGPEYNYLKPSQDPRAQEIWASIEANLPTSVVKDAIAGVALVKQGGWAYVAEDIYVQELVKNSYGQLVINPTALSTAYLSMGVRLNSPVLRPLNIALVKLIENGRLQQLLTKWSFN